MSRGMNGIVSARRVKGRANETIRPGLVFGFVTERPFCTFRGNRLPPIGLFFVTK